MPLGTPAGEYVDDGGERRSITRSVPSLVYQGMSGTQVDTTSLVSIRLIY